MECPENRHSRSPVDHGPPGEILEVNRRLDAPRADHLRAPVAGAVHHLDLDAQLAESGRDAPSKLPGIRRQANPARELLPRAVLRNVTARDVTGRGPRAATEKNHRQLDVPPVGVDLDVGHHALDPGERIGSHHQVRRDLVQREHARRSASGVGRFGPVADPVDRHEMHLVGPVADRLEIQGEEGIAGARRIPIEPDDRRGSRSPPSPPLGEAPGWPEGSEGGGEGGAVSGRPVASSQEDAHCFQPAPPAVVPAQLEARVPSHHARHIHQ